MVKLVHVREKILVLCVISSLKDIGHIRYKFVWVARFVCTLRKYSGCTEDVTVTCGLYVVFSSLYKLIVIHLLTTMIP